MKAQTKWLIDHAHSEITFKVRHLMIAHIKGSFIRFDARIFTTKKDFTTSEIDLWIDASSINTGDEKRDEHLRGADFFDVTTHKQITFTSSTMGMQQENNTEELWGELTIKGITKKIKLTVEYGGLAHDPYGSEKAGFSVTGKINRSDFGLVWNSSLDAGGLMLSDEIIILCEVELINSTGKNLTMDLVSSEGNRAITK